MCTHGLRKKTLFKFTLLGMAVFLLSFPLQAGTDELEALLQKSLKEAKAAGAQYDNDACGHYFIGEGEFVKTSPDGKSEHYPINRPALEPWGCNEAPNNVQVTNKFESRQSQTEDKTSLQYVVSAHGVYSFDSSPSTEIAGSVIDKNSKPVKNAEVKAENINLNKPPFTTQTDEQGKYSLKVTSGQYRVSAKAKSCKAEQSLWACSFGKILDAHSHVSRFPLDLVANCGDMELDVSGTYSTNIDLNIETVTMHTSHDGGRMIGKIPLSLDASTGQITGEGTLDMSAPKATTKGSMEDVTLTGKGSNVAYQWRINAAGHLDANGNLASLTLECAELGAHSMTAEVDVRAPEGGGHGSASHTEQAQACSGADWQVTFMVPWQEGAKHQVDRNLTKSFDGGQSVTHEIIDFTLGDKKEGQDKPAAKEKTTTSSQGKSETGATRGRVPQRSVTPIPRMPSQDQVEPNKKKGAQPRVGAPLSPPNVMEDGYIEETPNDADEQNAGSTYDPSDEGNTPSMTGGMNIPRELQEKIPQHIQEMMQQYGVGTDAAE